MAGIFKGLIVSFIIAAYITMAKKFSIICFLACALVVLLSLPASEAAVPPQPTSPPTRRQFQAVYEVMRQGPADILESLPNTNNSMHGGVWMD
jgi:hypothetical protein